MSDSVGALQEIEANEPPPAGPDDSLGEVVTHYWRLLRDYYWLIALACLISGAGAYAWTQQQPKVYEASSKIIYHQKQGNVFGQQIEQVEMLQPGNHWEFEQFWNTQKQVFQARWFGEKVVKREGLMDDPKFLPEPPKGESWSEDEKLDAATDKVLAISEVELQRESRVAQISVQSESRELAATVANGVADAYIDYTKEFQSGGLKKITNWFDSYVNSKRQDLESAQSKLQEFKQKNNILSFSYEDRQNLTASNMESVNKELMDVRTKLSSEQALLKQIEKMEEGGNARTVAELVESEPLEQAFQREQKLEADLANLRSEYLDDHPKVEAISNELESVRQNIDTQLEQLQSGIQNRVQLLEREKQNLEAELATLKERIFELNELGVDYTQLKDKTENLKELYQTVLKRSSELNINSMYEGNDIEVLEKAEVPEQPVSPSLPLNLALGLILGAGLGGSIVVILDALDTTIKSEADVAQHTDKPTLAMLPELKSGVLSGLEVIGDSAADTITHTAPKSSFAEGIKTLRTNLTFMSPDEPPEAMLVTSPGPGEGKTVTATNMAIAMAQSGQKTLLVDSDLRRPRVHKALDLNKEPGLSEVITGSTALDDAVQTTMADNLHAVSSGEVPPNPSEMLHSRSFENFVSEARQKFDRVVFDSPPLAAVSDALIISNLVDGVLLIIEFGKTRRETLVRSLEQLRGIGAPLLGCVLNEVSQDSTGYGYSYYRYAYYGDDDRENDTRLAS